MSEKQAKAQRRQAPKEEQGPTVPVNESEPQEIKLVGEPEDRTSISEPCVVVIRHTNENGNTQVQIAPMNGLDPLAIPTLLRLAADIQEKNLRGQ